MRHLRTISYTAEVADRRAGVRLSGDPSEARMKVLGTRALLAALVLAVLAAAVAAGQANGN